MRLIKKVEWHQFKLGKITQFMAEGSKSLPRKTGKLQKQFLGLQCREGCFSNLLI
jgi:hypothetical protein